MIDLRNENLRSVRSDVRIPDYDRSQLRPGIVHIGVGNFHRVHQATAIEECLCVPGNEYWAISGVGLTNGSGARQKTAAYRLQSNLYTVTELKSDMSMVTRVVGAMAEYLHAPENPQRVLDRLTDPTTRIVSLTITEGGYNIDETTGEFRLDQTSGMIFQRPLHAPPSDSLFSPWKLGEKPVSSLLRWFLAITFAATEIRRVVRSYPSREQSLPTWPPG